jgi:hypothetical protein
MCRRGRVFSGVRRLTAGIIIILALASLLSFSVSVRAAPVASTKEFYLHVNVDGSGIGIKDYYCSFQSWLVRNSTFFVGEINYQWAIERLQDNEPNYDYYLISINETLTLSEHWNSSGVGLLLGGRTEIYLLTNDQMFADYQPGNVLGPVEIHSNMLLLQGGAPAKWRFNVNVPSPLDNGVQSDRVVLNFSAKVRTNEGTPVHANASLDTQWTVKALSSYFTTPQSYTEVISLDKS